MDSLQSNESVVVVARRSLAIRLYYGKYVIWMISNQITKFQIESKSNHTFSKSNHYVWFNHDLNQIMIWICPSLIAIECGHLTLTLTQCGQVDAAPAGASTMIKYQLLLLNKNWSRSRDLDTAVKSGAHAVGSPVSAAETSCTVHIIERLCSMSLWWLPHSPCVAYAPKVVVT